MPLGKSVVDNFDAAQFIRALDSGLYDDSLVNSVATLTADQLTEVAMLIIARMRGRDASRRYGAESDEY